VITAALACAVYLVAAVAWVVVGNRRDDRHHHAVRAR
jgi:hypothetical protein